MAIKETEVWIRLNGKYIKYYEDLGYEIPRKKDKWGDVNFTQGTMVLVKIEHVPKGSEVRVTKICDFCDTKVENVMYCEILKARKYISKDSCSKKECVGMKLSEVNRLLGKKAPRAKRTKEIKLSLLESSPEVSLEYHPTLNDKPPEEVYVFSDKKVWWICNKNPEHIWDATPKHRTKRQQGCPFCSGNRVSSLNSLESIHPEVAAQWHPTLNGDLTPDRVAKASGQIAWWLCSDCNSAYDMAISLRTLKNGKAQNCPYCAGMRVNHTNCLATTNPELLQEWHPLLNTHCTPYNITKNGEYRIWWVCSKCNHEWNTDVGSRTNSKSGCPKCKATDGEKETMRILDVKNVKYNFQHGFPDLKSPKNHPMWYDFAILDKTTGSLLSLIEYDDYYHFKNKKGFPPDKRTVEYDNIKNEYCKSNNIKLLRIPYWEYDNIESILDEWLNECNLNNTYLKSYISQFQES